MNQSVLPFFFLLFTCFSFIYFSDIHISANYKITNNRIMKNECPIVMKQMPLEENFTSFHYNAKKSDLCPVQPGFARSPRIFSYSMLVPAVRYFIVLFQYRLVFSLTADWGCYHISYPRDTVLYKWNRNQSNLSDDGLNNEYKLYGLLEHNLFEIFI